MHLLCLHCFNEVGWTWDMRKSNRPLNSLIVLLQVFFGSLSIWLSSHLNWSGEKIRRVELSMELHLRAIGHHLTYVVIQCYQTQVNTPHLDHSLTSRYLIYLPRRDRRLSWPKAVSYCSADGAWRCHGAVWVFSLAFCVLLNGTKCRTFFLILLCNVICCTSFMASVVHRMAASHSSVYCNVM